jgi:hypothetical protein
VLSVRAVSIGISDAPDDALELERMHLLLVNLWTLYRRSDRWTGFNSRHRGLFKQINLFVFELKIKFYFILVCRKALAYFNSMPARLMMQETVRR